MSSEPVTPTSNRSEGSLFTPSSSSNTVKMTAFISPSRSPSTGQLTGIPRKIKDCAADWHNKINDWKKYRQQGARLLQYIFQSKQNMLNVPEVECDEETDGSANHQNSQSSKQLQAHTDDLLAIHASMAKIVKKLEDMTKNLESISDAERSSDPYFKTWETYQFYEASRELLVMYQNELALKETIVHNMAHTSDRNLSMTMVAAWIHEPYIKERADLILESLVQETGLR